MQRYRHGRKIRFMETMSALLEDLARGFDEKLTAVSRRTVQTLETARREVRDALQQAITELDDSSDRNRILRARETFKSQVGMALLKASRAFNREANITMKHSGGDIINWLNQQLSKQTS